MLNDTPFAMFPAIPELLNRALLISKEQLEQSLPLQADEQASRKQAEHSDQHACGDGSTISWHHIGQYTH